MNKQNRKLNNILVTGGAGFIGCNFIHYLFGNQQPVEKLLQMQIFLEKL